MLLNVNIISVIHKNSNNLKEILFERLSYKFINFSRNNSVLDFEIANSFFLNRLSEGFSTSSEKF